MRLINIHTLELEEFIGRNIPAYCILSHRWTNDEITYKDFRKGRRKDSAGYQKIASFCSLVRDHMTDCAFFRDQECRKRWQRHANYDKLDLTILQYAWVDTCCINKDSSTELTEAINSMYKWYKDAVCCFAYLADVPFDPSLIDTMEAFGGSEWFRRGWTLQELLAPDLVIFCDQRWRLVGRVGQKSLFDYWRPFGRFEHPSNIDCLSLCHMPDLTDQVSAASGITKRHLYETYRASIAVKMSWAAARTTTRVEDQAYCLMGIFDVNMPLLYGEGERAFERLQQELVKASNDQSIFAWTADVSSGTAGWMFAHLPYQFRHSNQVRKGEPSGPYELTNRGLRIFVEYMNVPFSPEERQQVLIRLDCSVGIRVGSSERGGTVGSDSRNVLGLPQDLRPVMTTLIQHKGTDQWYRSSLDDLGAADWIKQFTSSRSSLPGKYLALHPQMSFNERLEYLLVNGEWQEPKVFFVKAFRGRGR